MRKYTWDIRIWRYFKSGDTFTEHCRKLEDGGWEIFSVETGSDYAKVIVRKPRVETNQ